MRTRFAKLFCFSIWLFLAPLTWAADSLNFFNNWFVTGDYVVAGVGLRGGGAGKNAGWATGNINVTGVPSNAQPIAAFLYWSTVETSTTPGAAIGYFNGKQIQGSVLGNPASPNPPCWASGSAPAGSAGFVYRADVLRFLPINSNNVFQANGTQTVKLPDSTGGTVLYTNGASLVVIYRIVVSGNPLAAPLRAVVIYDGAFTITKKTAPMTLTVSSLFQTSTKPLARVTGIVANGQEDDFAPWSINGTTLSASPFEGEQGNRWDNASYNINLPANASSFSTLQTVSSPQACLTWAAVVASANVQDSDNDGLLDIWETAGLYQNTTVSPAVFGTCADAAKAGQPCVNLPAMGANPSKKDIFIQMDWMYSDGSNALNAAHNHIPPLSSLSQVAATFALHNINLHFDVGNNYQGPQGLCGNAACSFIIPAAYAAARPVPDTASGINEATLLCPANATCDYGNLPYPVTSFEFGFDSIRDGNQSLGISAHLSPDRFWAFRYGLFAHAIGGPYNANGTPINPVPLSYSGIAQLPGGGFMVTFGLWGNPVGTPFQVANTIHHELGHTLGLYHGGLAPTPNCMPNYPSAMNYMYQIRGLTDANGNEQVDYSYGFLLPLNESHLNTSIPMALPGVQHYRVRYYGPLTGPLAPQSVPHFSASQAVAYHCDGTPATPGENLIKLEGPAVATPDWSDYNVAPGNLIPPTDLNDQGTTNQVFYDQPDWFVLNLQQIGSSPDFGGISVGAKTSDSGAKASDAGAKASESGAKATDMGAFPNTGITYSANAGVVSSDSGAKASDAGELNQDIVVLSGLDPPTQLVATNTATSIVLTWNPPNVGSNLTYNVYRCAGAGCTPSAPAFKTGINGGPTFTDTINDNTHGGTACPAADTCPNTIYVYTVTAVAVVNNLTVESPYSNAASSQVTEAFVVADSNAAYNNDNTYTYDGNSHQAAYHVFGLGSPNPASITCTTGRNASTYPASCSGVSGYNQVSPTDLIVYVASGATYTDGAGIHTGGSLIINKRPITVTAAASNKTYDATTSSTATPSITTGSLGTNDSVTWTESYDTPPVGIGHTMTPAGVVSDSNGGNNYSVTFVTTTNGVILTRPVTATLTAQNKVYDGTNTEPNGNMSCTLSNAVAGDNVSCGVSNGAFNSNQVTSATTVSATGTLTGTAATNYTFGAAGTAVNTTNPQITAGAKITTLVLSPTLTSAPSKIYDGTATETNPMTCSVATVISPDVVSCAATSGTFNTSQVTANLVTATATISGAAVSNYTLGAGGTTTSVTSTSVSTASSITTRPVTATLSAQSKPYDGSNTEPNGNMSCALTNTVSGDNVNCGASNGTFNSNQVVSATTVSATGTLGGTAATNYTFGATGTAVNTTSPQITASANITTLVLTPTLTSAPPKVFDGNTTETNPMTCSLATVISPDVVTCAATNGTFNSSQVLTANLVTATATISGAAVSNYTLGAGGTTASVTSTSVSLASSITPAPSTTTVTCPAGLYTYTGLPQVPPCSVSVTGAGGLSLTPPPLYSNNINAGLATASYTFASDGNHNGSNGSANFTISPASLAVLASSGSVTYGSPIPSITPGYSGFVNNENASVVTTPASCGTSYTPTSVSSAPPYPSYATFCSGAVAANYTFSYLPGSITVSQAPLQITASSATITVGDPVPTITAGYSGLVNNENASVLGTVTCSTTYTQGSPIGPYPTSCTGAVDNNYNISYVGGTVTVGTPAPATFSATGSLNTARSNPTATVLPNGQVLIAGGQDSTGAILASAELYDPSTGLFTVTGSMNAARYVHTATLLPTGKVLIAGGQSPATLASAELYDPSTGSFTLIAASMNAARSNHTATVLQSGKVLLAGGNNSGATAELYDPSTGVFTATSGSMNTPRYVANAALLSNGQVLIMGGISNGPNVYLASAELYDPVADSFTYTTNSMSNARGYFTATLLKNGQVLAAGGYDGSAQRLTADLYDPTAGTFSPTGSMTNQQGGPATLLANGQVLIAGGYNGSSLATAQLYDPIAQTFSLTGSMTNPRNGPAAVLLANGLVLVVGGTGNSGALASAELYAPPN